MTPARPIADVERSIEEYVLASKQAPALQAMIADQQLRVIKYMPAEYLASALATGQLYASERAGFTWGDAIYVAPIAFPLTTMMYGHVGVAGTFATAAARFFDAEKPEGIHLY